MVEVLRELGLSKRETEVYILLAKKGFQGVNSIATTLKMDRPQTYRALKSLQEKGVVEATIESPTRYAAISLETLIDSLVKEKKNAVEHLEADKQDLVAYWKSLTVEESEYPIARFQVVMTREGIYSKVARMVEESEKEILILTTSLGVIQEDMAGIFDKVKRSAQEKPEFQCRILSNVSWENRQIVKQTLEKINKKMNVEWRHIDMGSKFYPRFAIKDDEEAILYVMPRDDTSMPSKEDTGLWITSKMFISTLRSSFMEMWRNATDASERIEALESGKPVEETIIIKDETDAEDKIKDILHVANKEVDLVTSSVGIKRILSNSLFRSLAERSIKFRIMAPIDLDNFEVARKLAEKYEIRHTTISYLTMMMVDDGHLFMFKAPPIAEAVTESPFYMRDVFYTNDQEYLERIKEILNDIWKRGTDVSEIISGASKTMLIETSGSATLLEVAETMLKNNVSAVLVTENNRTTGIINEKELLRSIVQAQKDPRKTYAREVMSTPVLTIDAEEPLMDALRTMKEKGIERLAIMRKGKLVGMLAGNHAKQT